MENGFLHTLDVRREFPAAEFPVEAPVLLKGWRNGLLVRMPNHLGDAVMALPALKQLKTLLPPDCGLFVLAPAAQRYLYRSLPIVDGIFGLKRSHRLWEWALFLEIRRERFGAGVLFNNSFRDALLMRLAGVPVLFGAAARGRSLLLQRAFRFPPRMQGELTQIHQSNKLLAMVRALGASEWDGKMPEFRLLPPVDELACAITSLCRHPKLLTIASGAAYGPAKRWSSGKFRQVAEEWIADGGIVAVLGSPAESEIGERVISGLPAGKAYNLCGKTGLADLMHLLKASAVTVANDSGVMHLAAALGTPGVAVFGPTDYTATGPVSDNWSLLYRKEECSPCFARLCPQGECCRGLEAIAPELVISEVRRLTAKK